MDAVDGKMWNSDKSASCYCLYRYIDLYFWDHHWLSLLIHDEGGNGSDMLGAVTTPLTSWLEIMMLCHGEGDRQSDTFVSNSHKGYNFIHRHVLLLWTFIAINHFLCCFQSFVEVCLQSCCMWGLLHCRLVEISPQSCICQGFCTASLATNELIIKCVGENDPVCLFSAIFGNVLGWEIFFCPLDKVKIILLAHLILPVFLWDWSKVCSAGWCSTTYVAARNSGPYLIPGISRERGLDTKIPFLPVVYPLPQISPLKLFPYLVLKQLSILSIQMGFG